MAVLLYWIALDYTGVPNEVSSEIYFYFGQPGVFKQLSA